MSWARRGVAVLWATLLALAVVNVTSAYGQERVVEVIEVRGVIDPATADYIRGQLESAQRDEVHALVMQLDTPGGLDISMRSIIRRMLASDVPVVVWIAPRGARAASAGTFITYAAHLAYMAESTELGAASPVGLGGDSETLERKATNDAAAFIGELARERGRNEQWAEDAVRTAASLGTTEAVRMNVVNGEASSFRDLLEELDGQRVEVADGTVLTLETWDADAGAPTITPRFEDMSLPQQLLHTITSPELAFFLMLIGFFGIIFELYNPGIGLAGILGAVALILAFYSFSVLPTNWAGVLLIALAVAFFLVDLQTAGFGVWTVGGVVALVAGALLLFAGADPALALSPWAIVTATVATLVFFVSIMTAALRVRLRRPVTGEEAIVGTIGEATTDIAPEGMVSTRGTLWRARTMETGIAAGSKVKIMATEGLVLLVEPLHDEEQASV